MITTTITIFLLGALAYALLYRYVLILLRWGVGLVVVVVAGRLALMADDRLAQPSVISGALVGGVVAFVVVGLLAYSLIYHALIAADERRDIDRAHETAKRRRLW